MLAMVGGTTAGCTVEPATGGWPPVASNRALPGVSRAVAWTCRRAYFSPDREGRPSFAPKTAMAHPQRSGSLTRIVEDAGSENTSGGEGVGGGGVVEV